MLILYRQATLSDIPQIQRVRNAVKENVLSDPGKVTDADCADYLTMRGKGWVAEEGGRIIGFAIVDLQDHNIWALFLEPAYEGHGIGKKLHHLMLDWYFQQTKETVWLSTGTHTRAANFYRLQGWQEAGLYGSNETKFEMTYDSWSCRNLLP